MTQPDSQRVSTRWASPCSPPNLLLPAANYAETRAAIAQLDPENRLGAPPRPLFLSARADGDALTFLGLTGSGAAWLTPLAGAAFTDATRRGLDALLDGPPPDDPAEHATRVIAALHRRAPRTPITLSVLPCPFGAGSGSGLAHSADPVSGRPGLTGTFRRNATGGQLLTNGGEDLAAVAAREPWGDQLAAAAEQAQRQLGRIARIAFVIDAGTLWILDVRPARLAGAALISHAHDRWRAGELTDRQALATVTEPDLALALAPDDAVTGLPAVAHGVGVSPGTAHGVAVFSVAEALDVRDSGRRPALILPESRPEDLEGLLVAAAVVTERGGATSHAGVVARGLGKVCVTALTDATVDTAGRRLVPATGDPVCAGDDVVVDGRTGVVYRGVPPATKGTKAAPTASAAVSWLLETARRQPGIGVRVNADSPAEVSAGREHGAEGVGLCRIEHMCLGRRQSILERVLLGLTGAAALESLDDLGEELRAEFAGILREMDGRPVTVRLLDPPRHEFLPDVVGLTAEAAVADARGVPFPDRARLTGARRLWEQNPMLGVRGVRLAVLLPQLLTMQVRAIVRATLQLRREGRDPRPELLIPMVTTPSEVDAVRSCLAEVRAGMGEPGAALRIPVGVMIETPRAALLAGALAARADFFSVGTNDLTALVWGLSRDDADRELLPAYAESGLVESSPFSAFDVDGVGALLRGVVSAARAVNPDISIGVCGEHGANPAAAVFFGRIGVNYVSCVPSQIPGIRLAAARAAAGGGEETP